MINLNAPFLQNFLKVAIYNGLPDIEKRVENNSFQVVGAIKIDCRIFQFLKAISYRLV